MGKSIEELEDYEKNEEAFLLIDILNGVKNKDPEYSSVVDWYRAIQTNRTKKQ